MTGNGRAILSAILWAACIFIVSGHAAGIVRTNGVPIAGNDFPAFYCAGSALLQHADPYAVEPLRSCEHALPHGSDLPAQYVTPAPLPPYVLDLFALLAELPYRIAAWLWFGVLLAACAWLAITVGRVSQLPSGAVASALLISAVLGSVVFGQIPPLATLFIALCGAALLRGDDSLAAVCAAAATIEPHLGLPVALALFILRPGTRAWLAGIGLACAALSVLALSPHGTLAYLTTALPAQARAELISSDQFSLAHLLAFVHVPSSIALLGGTLSYLLMLVFGIFAANASARRLDAAAIAYVPPAVALFGGAFLHEIQLVAALPAAFLFVGRAAPLASWAGRFLIAAVAAVPFTLAMSHRPVLDVLALLCATGALVDAVPFGETIDFTHALGGFLLAAICVALPLAAQQVLVPPAPSHVSQTSAPATNLAGENWGAYLRSDPRYATPRLDAEASKLPAWLGLAALLVSALGMGVTRLGPRTQPAWDSRPRIHLSG
ncbi:MAG TPA: glycosyltransferase family 87 protein [Candidatus Dormibacteraeota bacterium]|nr:glycosyltransferase family 87 protein [Candidatus Dormibacteraeota bacterium]